MLCRICVYGGIGEELTGYRLHRTSRNMDNYIAAEIDPSHIAGCLDPVLFLRIVGVSIDPPPTRKFGSSTYAFGMIWI